jgi:membrane protease subunit HflK
VRDAFNGVNQAIQVRDRIINEAEGQVNQKIPAARGAKDRVVREAEGYKIGRVNRAQGATSAFLAVLAEYQKAKEVTRRRLYLEAMQEILPLMREIVLVESGEPGVLKLLDLSGKEGR